MNRTPRGDSSIRLRSIRPSVSVGVASSSSRARTVARDEPRIRQGRANARGSDHGGGLMPNAAPVFVGIDVAKGDLAVAVRPQTEAWLVPNDDKGIQELVARLRTVAPTLLVLEATGGYERPLVAALAAA